MFHNRSVEIDADQKLFGGNRCYLRDRLFFFRRGVLNPFPKRLKVSDDDLFGMGTQGQPSQSATIA